MAPSSSPIVVVAGGALVAAGIGLAVMSYKSSGPAIEEDALVVAEIDEDDDDDEPRGDYITESDVVKIFDALFLTLQQTFTGLMQQVQHLQRAGQRIPEAQLQALLRQEMERALVTQQAGIIEAAGIDEDCFEEATWEFIGQGNAKVKTAVERLQKMWQNATGEQVVGWRPGQKPVPVELLTASRTVEVAELYFTGLTNCMKNIIKQYKDDGKDLKDPAIQHELNLDFSQSAQDAGDAALATVDISSEQFQASVQSHANDPAVGRALAMLQQKQQMDLMEMQA